MLFVRLTIIFAHKSLCQNVNVCYFNFNNAHTAEILAVRYGIAVVVDVVVVIILLVCRRVAIGSVPIGSLHGGHLASFQGDVVQHHTES